MSPDERDPFLLLTAQHAEQSTRTIQTETCFSQQNGIRKATALKPTKKRYDELRLLTRFRKQAYISNDLQFCPCPTYAMLFPSHLISTASVIGCAILFSIAPKL